MNQPATATDSVVANLARVANAANAADAADAADAANAANAADAAGNGASRGARVAVAVGRSVVGALFAVFGANGLLDFIPHPETAPPERAGAFLGALAASGYLVPLMGTTMLIAGLLLVANRFVPLALVLLAPLLVNILAFHVALAPEGIALPLVLAAVTAALAWVHRDAYRPLFRARAAS